MFGKFFDSQKIFMTATALPGRRVLITAGPTWVRIDAVRHVSNVSSGGTGLALAREAARRGAEVLLLLGPGQVCPTAADRAAFRIQPFITFDDLHAAVREQLTAHRFEVLIHAAAVSDYRPVAEERGKLSSGEEELVLRMRPTPKIVDEVKELAPEILLVKFKLEVARSETDLLAIAERSRARSGAELIVANDLDRKGAGKHRAYLLDAGGVLARTETTEALAERLLDEVGRRLTRRPHPEPPAG